MAYGLKASSCDSLTVSTQLNQSPLLRDVKHVYKDKQ